MLKPHVLSWFIVLFVLVEPAHAETALNKWEKCMGTAESGPEAQRIERESGVDGLFEHALDVCGFKPTADRTRLAKEDCDRLFEMPTEIDCEPFGGSAADNNFLKTLNTSAFNEDKYWVMCRKIQLETPSVSRQQFGREVCGE